LLEHPASVARVAELAGAELVLVGKPPAGLDPPDNPVVELQVVVLVASTAVAAIKPMTAAERMPMIMDRRVTRPRPHIILDVRVDCGSVFARFCSHFVPYSCGIKSG